MITKIQTAKMIIKTSRDRKAEMVVRVDQTAAMAVKTVEIMDRTVRTDKIVEITDRVVRMVRPAEITDKAVRMDRITTITHRQTRIRKK